jgi:chromosome segregation ATPase
LILLQNDIDYLLRIKSSRFSISTPTDNLFFLDTNIEHDLSQLQLNYHRKLNEINQEIEQITENQFKSERLKMIIKSIEDNLNSQENHLKKISHQRQLDNEFTFENLSQLIQQIEQIQNELNESSKTIHQLSIEHLKIKLENLQTISNDEYIHFNRLINEYKSLNQIKTNYNELSQQINQCIVSITQYVDNRSRMISPELQLRSPTDQLVQLNIYRIQIQEQLDTVEHHKTVTSKFIEERIGQLRHNIVSLKNEIESILVQENETTSIQIKVDRLIENLQNEFDRQPIFSSILTPETLETYERLAIHYFQSLHHLENELIKTIEQFQDTGLLRQYKNRLNQIEEQIKQIEFNIKNHSGHLRQGLSKKNILQHKLLAIIEDLDNCESQLTNTIIMKEYQVKQKLQVFSKKIFLSNNFIVFCRKYKLC